MTEMTDKTRQAILTKYAKLMGDADLYERIFQILGKQEYRDVRNHLRVTIGQMSEAHPWLAKEYAKCSSE